MELTELKDRIIKAFTGSHSDLQNVLTMIDEDVAIYPFNDYEHLICNLINIGGLSYEKYIEIRSEYLDKNPNLWIFEISAPRKFGEKFAQTYIKGMSSKILNASKELDPGYSGQYDLWLDGITIEVKASRAVDKDSKDPLYMKALSTSSRKRFLMNYQQLKPQCCDIFIWVAVFRDDIILWIMNSSEVQNHPLYSKGQHRGNIGNEGQLHVKDDNVHLLDKYKYSGEDIVSAIKIAAKRARHI